MFFDCRWQERCVWFPPGVRNLTDLRQTDVDIRTDITTRAIDSLFLLGRTTLEIANPQTYIPAYDYLDNALGVVDMICLDSNNQGIDTPNYLRCISGAFYNLAGSLYQSARYGAAVPFLKQTCSIGTRALEEHKAMEIPSMPKAREKAKERESEWLQLEQQLYRRWELLAVCYLKNGDRRVGSSLRPLYLALLTQTRRIHTTHSRSASTPFHSPLLDFRPKPTFAAFQPSSPVIKTLP